MNIWIKRYIGIVTIGGGTLGLASIVDYFYNQLLLAQVVLLILMCSFFLWSAAIGMLILEGNCTRKIWYQALWVQLLQVPLIITPLLKYQAASGLYLYLVYELPMHFFMTLQVGSKITLGFFEGGGTQRFGVNVIAVVASMLIYRYTKSIKN